MVAGQPALLRYDQPLPTTLSAAEMDHFIGHLTATTYRVRCLVWLLKDGGLRVHEALDLRLGDIHWSKAAVTVRSTKSRTTRLVPLSADAMALLGAYIHSERPLDLGHDHVFVCLGRRSFGKPLTYRAWAYICQRTRQAADTPNVRVHAFRHTCATNLAEALSPLDRGPGQGTSGSSIWRPHGERSMSSCWMRNHRAGDPLRCPADRQGGSRLEGGKGGIHDKAQSARREGQNTGQRGAGARVRSPPHGAASSGRRSPAGREGVRVDRRGECLPPGHVGCGRSAASQPHQSLGRSAGGHLSRTGEQRKAALGAGAPGPTISPDCADAYALPAEATADPQEPRRLYEQGVQAGERALGPETFTEAADTALKEAREINPHVPLYLLGVDPLPQQLPNYYSVGDRNEAVSYLVEGAEGWLQTPGAMKWLEESLLRLGISSAGLRRRRT